MNGVFNVGALVTMFPAWGRVKMSSGWGKFWEEMRKIAKALKKQPSDEARRVALCAIRTALGAEEDLPMWLSLLTWPDPSS